MKKRLISLLAVLAMMVSLIPSAVVQAQMSINIGDYVQMGTYYGKPILWRCVDIDEHGPLMLSDKILCLKAWDESGDNTSSSHGRGYNDGYYRKRYGSNYWVDSNIRDWLNSESGSVTWSCGNPPDKYHLLLGYNAYDKEAGFLTNFTQSERNAILPVTQKSLLDGYEHDSNNRNTNYHRYNTNIADVVQNYDTAYSESVTDKMFLLDVKQVNNVYNNLGDYYTAYPTQECIDNSEYKDSDLNVGNKWRYWLRSPGCHYYDSYYVRCVWGGGNVSLLSAYSRDLGVRPAFYLDLTSSSIDGGSGTESNPYTIEGGSGGNNSNTDKDLPENTSLIMSKTGDSGVRVRVINGDAVTNGKLILVKYDADNRITGIQTKDNGQDVIFNDVDFSLGKLKTYMWNSDMEPLSKTAELTLDEPSDETEE